MHCPKCGTENPTNALFCKNCGTKLGVDNNAKVEVNQSSGNIERPISVNNEYSNNQSANQSNNSDNSNILTYIGCCCACIIILYAISMLIY